MATTYEVRIYKTDIYRGKTKTTYWVQWSAAGRRHKRPFATSALADSFRSKLVSAAREGIAFDVETGLPVTMIRAEREMSWLDFARAYVDMKWPRAAGNSRKGIAETLTTVTPVMFTTTRGKPADEVIRKALNGWVFNPRRRQAIEPTDEIRAALSWVERNTRPVSTLSDPSTVRTLLDRLALKLDGTPAAPSVVKRKRAVLHNALEYAVELRVLGHNPLPRVKWTAPKTVKTVDRRVVVNPRQAACLLRAVAEQQPSGPRLVAFFGVLYYAAARPGEAINLRKQDLSLPEEGWGEILLWESAPETGASWSDTGRRRDRRELKHRAKGETRVVPCPPPLTALLQEHLRTFGTNSEGYLFFGVRTGELISGGTYTRVWRKARQAVLTPEEYASPLARRPYDLRHAAVSTWLNGGVPPTQVAEWAGHSVHVLLQVYAKCLVGQEETARRRIEDMLKGY